ncbi:hypothetical protein BGZ65_005951, partial [Modicella reniformis]
MRTLASMLQQPPFRHPEGHHAPMAGIPNYTPPSNFGPPVGTASRRPSLASSGVINENIPKSTGSAGFSRSTSYHAAPAPTPQQQQQQQYEHDPVHDNPYRAPSLSNSCAFVPPKAAGYEFKGGSQAGKMGLMIGKRTLDGALITAKLHQSRILLQHEHRILKRLEIINVSYDPDKPISPQIPTPSTADSISTESLDPESTIEDVLSEKTTGSDCNTQGLKQDFGAEAGLVEGEKYFNRIVEDFVDLKQAEMSILIMRRLGLNMLSPFHHRFLGLEETDGYQCPESHARRPEGSPFPDIYTFLIFCLKAASLLESLERHDLAHLALYWDVNKTELRLFDFTHAKILSHERARAPSNISEWQIPGYLEYHLQFLAPEQTGRAETWMDHRTDVYGLGATLFTLLTMQFPNCGNDSVQILQGILSRDLPPLRTFRPDMPLIIDDILRKMTQKQPNRRYQTAFGFKQDILRCLNELHRTGVIESFPLGKHDVSFQFVLPNTVFGRQVEQQMISTAISQAANAYQHSLNSDMGDSYSEDGDASDMKAAAMNDFDNYIFVDDIIPLQNKACTKIPLSSKTLLMTPKLFDGGKAVHRGPEATDPV